jgi:hypothetical protein
MLNEYTLGVSRYIVGNNLKVQSDVTYIDRELANGRIAIRLQFEIQF